MKAGIVLGSRSQWNTLQHTAKLLIHFGIAYEARIITAHKNSNRLHEYACTAIDRNIEIIIASSFGVANLPDILASNTEIPVIGIQIKRSNGNKNINGLNLDHKKGNPISIPDSGPGHAVKAALFAANRLANKYPAIHQNLINYCRQHKCQASKTANAEYLTWCISGSLPVT